MNARRWLTGFPSSAALAAVLMVVTGCAHRADYRGGAYANFTFAPATPPSPQVSRDAAIARDEHVLAEEHDVDPARLRSTLGELVQLLCASHREQEVRQVIETYGRRAYGPNLAALSYECGFGVNAGTPRARRNGSP